MEAVHAFRADIIEGNVIGGNQLAACVLRSNVNIQGRCRSTGMDGIGLKFQIAF